MSWGWDEAVRRLYFKLSVEFSILRGILFNVNIRKAINLFQNRRFMNDSLHCCLLAQTHCPFFPLAVYYHRPLLFK